MMHFLNNLYNYFVLFWHFTLTVKRTKWDDLIFEVEKLKIFQLQKLNHPERNISPARLLYAVQNSECKVPK
jgi:hypothetical protein